MKKNPITPLPNQNIDWSEIHRRVGSAAAPQQDNRAILKARASALAREPQQAASQQEILGIIEFRLGAETYGVESAFVREVYPLKDFTALPGLPPFIVGILNVRGQILSIVELKVLFKLPEMGLGQLNKLIILRNHHMEFGILADEILGARALSLDAILAVPVVITGIGADYLRGVTSEGVIILDAGKILGDENMIVHQEADQ